MKFLILVCLFFVTCTKVNKIQSSNKVIPSYEREDWKHWIDSDKDCQNTRHEILISRSEVDVILNKKGCSVKSGKWADYYYPQYFTKAKDVDVDHLIPLKNAHIHGASSWSFKEKEKFANDPENLVLTSKKFNRSKGAKGIDAWLPVHPEYACKYVKDWIKLKKKYQLEFDDAELHTIETLRPKCP